MRKNIIESNDHYLFFNPCYSIESLTLFGNIHAWFISRESVKIYKRYRVVCRLDHYHFSQIRITCQMVSVSDCLKIYIQYKVEPPEFSSTCNPEMITTRIRETSCDETTLTRNINMNMHSLLVSLNTK